jgi:hypothetical protein
LAVTDAIPQNSWATSTMNSSTRPRSWPAASMNTCAGGNPVSVARVAA